MMKCSNCTHTFLTRSMNHLISLIAGILILSWIPPVFGNTFSLEVGQPIPSVTVIGKEGKPLSLGTLKGKVTVISIVPQLNTPVCDEQTHRFSEHNEGLDAFVTFITLSTNTHTDQARFAKEAKIHNMTFLSDAPDFHFGRKTGLLLDDIDILHRAVIVLDADFMIRYIEIVPMSQLPDFGQAYRAAQRLLPTSS